VGSVAHPANASVLRYLAHGAAVSASPSAHNIDEYVLRTHPDLTEALERLGLTLRLPPGAAYGYAVLAAPGGVLFAIALGTASTA
jgi:hypothetical protein